MAANLTNLAADARLLGPIMASVLPGRRARRAGARARALRRGPRLLVTAWVLVAIPLLAAALGLHPVEPPRAARPPWGRWVWLARPA